MKFLRLCECSCWVLLRPLWTTVGWGLYVCRSALGKFVGNSCQPGGQLSVGAARVAVVVAPPEWQLLLFSWLDKYKLWEFNSHQRLVLVRIYIHTQTYRPDIHFYRVCFCLCLWQLFVAFSISWNFALICLSSSAIFVFCCFLFDALSKVRNSFISNATWLEFKVDILPKRGRKSERDRERVKEREG